MRDAITENGNVNTIFLAKVSAKVSDIFLFLFLMFFCFFESNKTAVYSRHQTGDAETRCIFLLLSYLLFIVIILGGSLSRQDGYFDSKMSPEPPST